MHSKADEVFVSFLFSTFPFLFPLKSHVCYCPFLAPFPSVFHPLSLILCMYHCPFPSLPSTIVLLRPSPPDSFSLSYSNFPPHLSPLSDPHSSAGLFYHRLYVGCFHRWHAKSRAGELPSSLSAGNHPIATPHHAHCFFSWWISSLPFSRSLKGLACLIFLHCLPYWRLGDWISLVKGGPGKEDKQGMIKAMGTTWEVYPFVCFSLSFRQHRLTPVPTFPRQSVALPMRRLLPHPLSITLMTACEVQTRISLGHQQDRGQSLSHSSEYLPLLGARPRQSTAYQLEACLPQAALGWRDFFRLFALGAS